MDRQAGFTLFEVLVAFVIGALALAALFGVLVRGVHSALLAGQYEDALAQAQSRLAALGRGMPIIPGERSGTEGGFRWRLRITPVAVADFLPPTALYAVTVAVSWGEDGDQREIRLESRRLGPAQPPAP